MSGEVLVSRDEVLSNVLLAVSQLQEAVNSAPKELKELSERATRVVEEFNRRREDLDNLTRLLEQMKKSGGSPQQALEGRREADGAIIFRFPGEPRWWRQYADGRIRLASNTANPPE